MSFLLRNNNNNPSKKRTGLGGGSGINVRPNHPQQRNHKIHAAAPSSRTAHHHGQQQQQQVLIQRPPIQQQQRPAVQQQSAVQKQGQEQDGSAMISMDDGECDFVFVFQTSCWHEFVTEKDSDEFLATEFHTPSLTKLFTAFYSCSIHHGSLLCT